jgi:hypothetical protein
MNHRVCAGEQLWPDSLRIRVRPEVLHAANNRLQIGQDRTRLRSRDKHSVIAIRAISKCFPRDESVSWRHLHDSAAGSRKDFRPGPKAANRLQVRAGEGLFPFRGMVERAMKFDVMQGDALRFGKMLQRADLMEQKHLEFGGRYLAFAAPKINSIPGSRMCAEAHAKFLAEPDALGHGAKISCMPAASDIGGRDPTHEGARPRARFPFPKIAVEVKIHEADSTTQSEFCSRAALREFGNVLRINQPDLRISANGRPSRMVTIGWPFGGPGRIRPGQAR